jgi:membrane protein
MATKTQDSEKNKLVEALQSAEKTPAVQTAQKNVKPIAEFFTKFSNDWVMNLAAALAYNLMMAIFPIVLALLAIFGTIVGTLDPQATTSLINSIKSAFPAQTSASIVSIINASQSQLTRATGILWVIAIILALFNGSRLFILIEGCFDIIYHVRPRAPIPQNVMAFVMLLLFIILLPIMVAAASGPAIAFSILQKTPLGAIPGAGLFFNAGGIIGALLAAYIFFQVIYIVVPNQKISFHNSWLGAVVATVLLELYLILFPLYVERFLLSGPIAAVGSLIILLIFFYYFAVILLLGAEVNASFAEGVRSTPSDLVTMVHTMTSHMPTTEQALKEQAAADHKDVLPKEIQPKTGGKSGKQEQTKGTPTLYTGLEDNQSKQQKSHTKGPGISTIIEAVAGTALAFIVELIRLRQRKK